MEISMRSENWKSLDIYGKVIDQNGIPVSGAKVEASIGLNVSMVESGGEYKYTKTDSQGLFSFLGIHGAGAGITPQKEGYFYNQRLLPGRPKDYVPDPNNPLVFTMWKIHGAEPLVASDIDAKITPEGNAIAFDIGTGKESDNGNLRVTLLRSPLEVQRGKFNWSAKIQIINGGLVEENDPYPYLAPENGYQPLFEFNVSSNDVPWHPYLDEAFYVKNSQGQYGLMKLHINSSVTPARFTASFTINPSGSQNLEPSSAR
jgi:hypothetical protein